MRNILLLHGAIGSAAQLEGLKKRLEGGYQVHSPDFPGHGGKPGSGRFSIPAFASYVLDYCKLNQLASVSVFGYSMGGFVALYLARHHPGIVEKIITLATKFHWDEETAGREIKMLQPEKIEQKLPQFAGILQQRHGADNWKEVLHKTADMLKELGEDNALKTQDFRELTLPCLLLLGDRDKMVSLEETASVYNHLPNAQLSILPGTPHPLEAVDMDLLAFMIRRFTGQ